MVSTYVPNTNIVVAAIRTTIIAQNLLVFKLGKGKSGEERMGYKKM